MPNKADLTGISKKGRLAVTSALQKVILKENIIEMKSGNQRLNFRLSFQLSRNNIEKSISLEFLNFLFVTDLMKNYSPINFTIQILKCNVKNAIIYKFI